MRLKIKEVNFIIRNKWFALFVFLIFMALSSEAIDFIRTTNGVNPTFFETLLSQTNETQMILFPLMYVLLLFLPEGNMNIKNEKKPTQLLMEAILSTSLLLLFFIAANLLYCVIFLDTSTLFRNVWSYVSEYIYIHMSPLSASSFSLLLLFFRFSFFILLIDLINKLTRTSHWGFWSVFFISYIDFMFYNFLRIRYPWGVLPLEHTKITYTEAYIPDNTTTRIPYYTSILYWLGLLAVVFFILLLVYKRRRKDEKYIH